MAKEKLKTQEEEELRLRQLDFDNKVVYTNWYRPDPTSHLRNKITIKDLSAITICLDEGSDRKGLWKLDCSVERYLTPNDSATDAPVFDYRTSEKEHNAREALSLKNDALVQVCCCHKHPHQSSLFHRSMAESAPASTS